MLSTLDLTCLIFMTIIIVDLKWNIFITIVLVIFTTKLLEKIMKEGLPKCTIEEKPDQEIAPGEKAFLKANCVFHATLRSVRWHKIKHGTSVAINIHSQKYEGSSNDYRNPVLCINSFDESDDASYRLEVQYFLLTEYSDTVKLKTKKDTEQRGFIVRTDSHLYLGRDICLKAISTVEVEKALSIVWHREKSGIKTAIDLLLSKYEGSSLEGNDPVLRIKSFNEEDVGEYFLTYADEWGTHESSHFLAKLEEGPPNLNISGPAEADLGSTIKLTANILSFPIISEQAVWFKDGMKMIIDTSRMQKNHKKLSDHKTFCELTIKSLETQDRGDYYLVASNEKGNAESNVLKLDVYGASPEIEIESRSESGEYGKEIRLKVKVKSRPKVTEFRWIKEIEGNTFYLDLSRKKYENSSHCTLTIKNLHFHDEGRYRLYVSNGFYHCRSDWLLVKVTGNPSFLISGPTVLSSNRKIELLGSTLKTRVNSVQGIWRKDGSDISLTDQRFYGSSNESTHPKLIITGVTPEDSGKYSFCAGEEKSNEVPVHVSDDIRPSSDYENNCLRSYQLVNLSAEALRIKLMDLVKDLPTFLTKEKEKIKDRVQTKQFAKLFPGNQAVAVLNQFDTSVLYTLLRIHSPLTLPNKKRNTNPKDNAERVRDYRNEICHLEKLKVETSKFNEDWLGVAKAVESLSNGSLLPKILSIQSCATIEGEQMQIMQKEIERLKEEMSEFEGMADRSKISTATYIFANVHRKEKSTAVTQYIDQICRIFDILFSCLENSALTDLIFEDLKSNVSGFLSCEAFNFLETVKNNMKSVKNVPESYVKEATLFAVKFKKKFNFPDVNFKSSAKCITLIIQFTSDEDHKSYQADVKNGNIEHSFQDTFLHQDILKTFKLNARDFSLSIKDLGKFDKSEKINVTVMTPSKSSVGEMTYIRGLILSPIKPHCVTWRKDGDPIDISDEKYEGSTEHAKHPLLCINNTSQQDAGMYNLMVSTAVETAESSKVPVAIKSEHFERPPEWSKMPSDVNCMLFEVPWWSPEFEEIKKRLSDSNYAAKVWKIDRIQNEKWLYQYTITKQHLQMNRNIPEIEEEDSFASVDYNFFRTENTEKPKEYFTTATGLFRSQEDRFHNYICLCSALYGRRWWFEYLPEDKCLRDRCTCPFFEHTCIHRECISIDSWVSVKTDRVWFANASQILPKYLIHFI